MVRDRLGVADSVVAGLGAVLGAGLFAGLVPASALVGRWLPVALVLAAVPALLTCCSPDDRSGDRWTTGAATGLRLTSRAAAAATLAGCFGQYVAPNRPTLPALGLLIVAVALDALDIRPSRSVTRALTLLVLVVLALVVAACFAIPPPPPTGVVPPPGTPGLDRPDQLLPAAGVLFFAFLGVRRVTARGSGRRTPKQVGPVLVLVALGGYLAVGAAVLRQLGPTRLAVSSVPLRDALDAADAALLDPAVTIAAAVATALALLMVLGARTDDATASGAGRPGDRHPWLPGALVGAAAALGVLVAGTADAIALAATCALLHNALTTAPARLLSRGDRQQYGENRPLPAGVESRSGGVGSLSAGAESPSAGVESLPGGAESLAGGVESRSAEVESPSPGVESLAGGVESPSTGVESRSAGVESLPRGVTTWSVRLAWVGVAVSVLIAAAMPVVDLGIALAVAVLGGAAGRFSGRPRSNRSRRR
jgi:APA family basic amino acid/polyamine antiporter